MIIKWLPFDKAQGGEVEAEDKEEVVVGWEVLMQLVPVVIAVALVVGILFHTLLELLAQVWNVLNVGQRWYEVPVK